MPAPGKLGDDARAGISAPITAIFTTTLQGKIGI
jgi:hypothetical protein